MARKQVTSLIRWVYPALLEKEQDAYEEGTSLVPELIMLGYQKYAEAYPLPMHRHKHGYEFVYLEHGSITWEVDGVHYPTHAGQWFYTSPREFHKARFDHMEPSRIWWFILNEPSDELNWFRLNVIEREFIMKRIGQLPRVFRAGNRVHEQFLRLKASLESESPDKALFARHQLLDILLGFLQFTPSTVNEPGLKDVVIRSVNQMVQSPEKRFSIAEMAQAVQVSESHFYKLFHEIFGQSPAAYMVRIRMERACALLKTDIPITEVALELGFATSQHFTTVFKKLIGSSPSEWRKHTP